MIFEPRTLLQCLWSIKYVTNVFPTHSGSLKSSKRTLSNTEYITKSDWWSQKILWKLLRSLFLQGNPYTMCNGNPWFFSIRSRKILRARDVRVENSDRSKNFFFRVQYHYTRKKKLLDRSEFSTLTSRTRRISVLRNTFHSVNQLQGSGTAEHPINGLGFGAKIKKLLRKSTALEQKKLHSWRNHQKNKGRPSQFQWALKLFLCMPRNSVCDSCLYDWSIATPECRNSLSSFAAYTPPAGSSL